MPQTGTAARQAERAIQLRVWALQASAIAIDITVQAPTAFQ